MTISHITLDSPDVKSVTYSFPGPQGIPGPAGTVGSGTVTDLSIADPGLSPSTIVGLEDDLNALGVSIAASPPGARPASAGSVVDLSIASPGLSASTIVMASGQTAEQAIAATPPGSRTPTAGSVTQTSVGSNILNQSSIRDVPVTFAARKQQRMPRRSSPVGPRRITRSITKQDIRVSRDGLAFMDNLHRSLHRKTLFATLGKTEVIWIDQSFPGYDDIASVSYYLNDGDLTAGLTTPSTSPIVSVTDGPFSLGGKTANYELSPWLMSGVTNWDTFNTLSVLVTYKDGSKEVTSPEFFATETYLPETLAQTLIALTDGEELEIGPGVIDFRNMSSNQLRSVMAKLVAVDNVIIDATGPAMSSLSGSNCTFAKDFEVVGGIIIRGDDYVFEGDKGHKQFWSYPAWLAPGTESTSRVLQIDGIGYSSGTGTGNLSYRAIIRHAVIQGTISDLLNSSRAVDVTLDSVIFGDGWDLVSNSHTDGFQISGSLFASGNLKDSEGDSVALYAKNCNWYGTNLILKPDLGPMDAVTFENCHWYNSGRVGVQLQPNSATNTVTQWVKFRNCTSFGHATYDFRNDAGGGVYVPIKTRHGVLTGASANTYASTEGELQYTNGLSGNTTPVVVAPSEFLHKPVSIRVGDLNKPTAINGSSFSVSRAGVSGYGTTYVIYVLLADPSVSIDVGSTGLSIVGSQALTGQGKLWVLQRANYDGTNAGPWTVNLSGSTTGVAFESANTFAGKGVESVVFATPAAYTAGGDIVAPDISTTGRGRQVKWVFGVIGTASASTWTKPTSVGGGSALSATIATQINTVESSNITTSAALLEAYRPQSYKTPVGPQGTLTAKYGADGYAFAAALVLGPTEEPPSRDVQVPGLDTSSILSRVDGLDGENLAEHLTDIYALAATAAGEVVDPHIFDAKGEILAATGNDTYDTVTPGANGLVPIYNSSAATGITPGVPYSGVSVATGQQQLTNTITETVVFGPVAIPSADIVAGRTYRIKLGGQVDNAVSGNVTLRTRIGAAGNGLGGTSFTSSGMTSGTAKTSQAFMMEVSVTFQANSGSAVPTVAGGLLTNSTSGTTVPIGGAAATNLNTSTDRELVITAAWAGASSSNVLRVEWAYAELVR